MGLPKRCNQIQEDRWEETCQQIFIRVKQKFEWSSM